MHERLRARWRPWRRAPWLAVLAIAMALALVAVACGDDEEEEQAPAAAPAVEEAAPTAEEAAPAAEEAAPADGPLKIGVLFDFTGALAEFGPVIQTGVDLAIKHINAAGGVLGQPVQTAVGDGGTDPTIAVEEARRLIDIEGIQAMVGPLASGVTLPVAEGVTGPAGIPTISPSATAPSLSLANDNGYLFRSVPSDAAQGPVLAQLATDEGFTSVAVVFRNDPYGQGLAETFAAAYTGTVTNSVSIETGQPSYLSELQKAAEGSPPALVAIGFPEEAQVFIREALENDLFTKFLFVDGTKSQDLIDAIGAEFLNGMKGTAPASGPETESTKAWNAAYTAEYGELPTRPFVREAYDATICIALAAELAQSTDGAAIRDALPQVCGPGGDTFIAGPESVAAALTAVRAGTDVNYEGAATSVDWNAVGDVTTGYIGIWQYANGTIEELSEVPFSLE